MSSSPPLQARPGQANGVATKNRLLDAAERLFAEHGIDGTSMRAITQVAGTSLSAANYHFGSKDELVRATFTRRALAINDRRLAVLDALESRSEPPSVEEIVDAFLRPIYEAQVEQISRGASPEPLHQIAVRMFADAPARVADLREELFGPLHRRFAISLRRSLPECREVDAEMAMQLAAGSLIYGPQIEGPPFEPLLAKMVAYAAAGIRAVARAAPAHAEPAPARVTP